MQLLRNTSIIKRMRNFFIGTLIGRVKENIKPFFPYQKPGAGGEDRTLMGLWPAGF
jgi:hypothetical protein